MIGRRAFAAGVSVGPWVLHSGLARAATRARVGLSLPLTGVQASVADELLKGYQLAFGTARSIGIEIDAVVEDDQAQVGKTTAAIRRFGLDASFMATSGIVGTPHAKGAIPMARTAGLPVVGIRSGAGELRDGGELVYHLRASYEAEISRMVGMLSTAQSRIAVVASDDAFGRPAVAYVQKAAAGRGLQVVKAVYSERNGADIRSSIDAATELSVRANALLILMITKPAIEGVLAARTNNFMGPVFTMSFTAGSELANAGPRVYRGLGLVSAFPLPRAAHDDVSEGFRRAATSKMQPELLQSVTAAEGYWYGTTLVRAIARCGDRVSRAALVQALEGAPGVRVGSEMISFDRERVGRRYLQVVYFDALGSLRA